MPDAAEPDASPVADAAAPDAAAPDAAPPDAAPPDAAPPPDIFAYWANVGGSVGRVNVDDNSNAGDIVSDLDAPFRVAVDPVDEHIYYAGGSATIIRADLDGSNPVDIIPTGESPYGMAIDAVNRKIYWSEFAAGRILRADLDGSNSEAILTSGFNGPSGVWVDPDGGKVYIMNYNSNALNRANLDGSGFETVAGNLAGFQGIDVFLDASTQKIYFSRRDAEIRIMDIDGSNQATFIGGQGAVHGMAVDFVAGKIYWISSGTIRRADLADGGNVEDIYATGANAWGLSILPTPAPAGSSFAP